jgi:Tol biopolymer transport system component/tRNA A-37 threonylcarbamoyl transferase component Bud32
MPLVPGTKLGPYEISSSLGAGGMGEVYLAQDTRLGRSVAIKILPDQFSSDIQRMARFDREAKLLASLNHPHIAAIYGLEESNGARALVMEFVEGPTLAERIKRGPLPLDEALPIAKQVAEALEYAHERNIIHRDLKPSNVKITPDGAAKVLDFGLAKALEDDISAVDISTSPTLSHAATQAGILLGTAAYMSPEQARGKKVDRRADIWSFGAVLYEMLTGKPAFIGETISDTLAAVIRGEPDWSALPGNLPPPIVGLLRRCLTKDPRQRLRDIGEARITIERVLSGAAEETAWPFAATREPETRWRGALPWAVAAIAVACAIGFGTIYWRDSHPESPQVMQLSLSLPEPLATVFDPNPGSPFAISPDGSQIVFVAAVAGKPQQLYLRPFDQQAGTPVPGTENATQPFFSPDGQSVGFFAQGKMRKVSLHGGPSVLLGEAPVPHGASWAADDTIIYAPNFGSGLLRISAAGGNPQILTKSNQKDQEISHRWPQVLPGGKDVLFTIQVGSGSSYDDARIAVLSLETGKWRTLLTGGSYARYVPPGHIVYARAGSLIAVPFDLSRMEVRGAPVPVQEGVVTTVLTSGGAEYDVTPSGLLAYVPGTAKAPVRSLVWVDRTGNAKTLPAPPRVYNAPHLSPDGKELAVVINDDGDLAVWIYEFARNTLTRLTFGPGISSSPVWTPDGRRIIYNKRTTTGSPSFYWKLADGSGKEEALSGREFDDPGVAPIVASPDGKTLLFVTHNAAGEQAIEALSLDGSYKVQPFLQSSFNLNGPRFSPDGRWVAYMTDESGRREVCVQPFPRPGGKWMISTDGGESPRWARNGREIFFFAGDEVMSVGVETQPAFKPGTPRALFSAAGYLGYGNYDVAPDGEHFLMIKQEDISTSPRELNVIVNWSDELARRVPPEKK